MPSSMMAALPSGFSEPAPLATDLVMRSARPWTTWQALAAERDARSSGEQALADKFSIIEGQFRNEAALREGGERRTAADLLELQATLQAEQACRESEDAKLGDLLDCEVAIHEGATSHDAMLREVRDQDVGNFLFRLVTFSMILQVFFGGREHNFLVEIKTWMPLL